ncbi:MAG: PEP-utilizing enzyme, partial [bacterium]|nr:PEP-utilizing enzyme [bacterium]
VVAGTRTPNPINEAGKSEFNQHLASLETNMPELYRELDGYQKKLENHYKDMQDLEFTIQEGTLYLLQTRTGKRTANAALRMAVEMYESGKIDDRTAVTRVTPEQLDILLHPIVDPEAEATAEQLGKGLPAGPGGATGQIVFTAQEAVNWAEEGKHVILVREETNPEDVSGMRAAQAVLTARGGMTSHAALVARGWGKCCIVGAGNLKIDAGNKTMTTAGGKILKEGDFVTLNGTKGYVYDGQLPLVKVGEGNVYFQKFLAICDQVRTLGVRANAETPADSLKAVSFGAEGIGLFRTEHMFYGEGSEEPLSKLRKMIVSKTLEERRVALDELFPYVKNDLKKTFEVMAGRPVTIRLLDPPLHEFVPHNQEGQQSLADDSGIPLAEIKARIDSLRESNPMMGHRGVRLGITYPEIAETQIRAIFEAAAELLKENKKVSPEIMIPVTAAQSELAHQKKIISRVYSEVLQKHGLNEIPHLVGTMIEIPRACLMAHKMAEESDFFSFGTNDLTQMGFGFSRDDVVGFMGDYIEQGLIAADPFQTIDQEGIGQLIEMTVKKGRKTKSDLKIGICGEQGGDPDSVDFCHRAGLNYVSCSPFRVPIARLSAAQAAVRHGTFKAESNPGCGCGCAKVEEIREAEAGA